MLKLKVNKLVYLWQQPASAGLSRSLLAGAAWLSWNPEMERKRSPLTSLLAFSLVYSWWKQDYVFLQKNAPPQQQICRFVYSNCSAFGKGKDVNNTLKCSEMQQYWFGMLFSHLMRLFLVVLWQNSFNNAHCSLKIKPTCHPSPLASADVCLPAVLDCASMWGLNRQFFLSDLAVLLVHLDKWYCSSLLLLLQLARRVSLSREAEHGCGVCTLSPPVPHFRCQSWHLERRK